MKKFLEKIKREINLRKSILRSRSASSGMTYVEIIVVLGIFGVISSIIIFNYGEFQAKIDIKNLASDIALKIVEAQKSSLSGKLPPRTVADTWKPSYGVYFHVNTNNGGDNKSFIYFTDLDSDGRLDEPDKCPPNPTSKECLDKITIVKGNNFISKIEKCDNVDCIPLCQYCNLTTYLVHLTFKRTDSGATLYLDTDNNPSFVPEVNLSGKYIQITVQSPKEARAKIKIYPSGRIEVK